MIAIVPIRVLCCIVLYCIICLRQKHKMRSLLLRRFSRICLSKPHALLGKRLCGARFLSETPIYHIVGAEHCGSGDIGRLITRNVNASPCDDKKEVLEKTVAMDLMTELGTIGASHGWVATLKDGVVRLQDDLNPNASDSEPKRISLPPLKTLPHCQTELVTNIAMSSSSPDKDQDCILAVKFFGPQLSLCRPAQKDPEWFNIRIEDPGFFSSPVMYTKTDKMFSMPGTGGTQKGSWDHEKHKRHRLHFKCYEELVQSQWERLSLSRRSEHLVEYSPTGQTFMVKWYRRGCPEGPGRELLERFLVFEILDNRVVVCVTDIGDLCIFLSSKGESFCLQASLYGLSPNCIYYVSSYDFGKVSIGDNVRVGGALFSPAPYFIPPLSYVVF